MTAGCPVCAAARADPRPGGYGRPVTTVVLVRHGLTRLTGPVLAGWTPGLHLDERGSKQADAVAARLSPLPLDALVSSPLDRCLDTCAAIAVGREQPVQIEDRLGECRYGDWTGRPLAELVKEPLWKVVQQHPSAVVFPGPEGEPLRETQNRAVAAVRDWNDRLGADATWLACSHGDVIKAIVADAMGLHLDQFQRITIDPCSVTVIRYTETRPFVVRVNDTGGGVDDLLPSLASTDSDAAVGGGAGSAAVPPAH
jgi:probable phosphomutase (TIGR03848 family)